MTSKNTETDKHPTPDPAENNVFFPSAYSLEKFTSSKSDWQGRTTQTPIARGNGRYSLIASEERYLLMQNGTMFSTGNHPVEMLLPMYHMNKAGFEFDIATLSGNPVKLELWALPKEDEAVQSVYQKYLGKLKSPLKLSDVIESKLGDDSHYIAVFIPGGRVP
ncbi:MAG: D-lactate dehydratase [Nitrospira sp.]|nr:D-lactate dehydratase [Nitrospira sp.]